MSNEIKQIIEYIFIVIRNEDEVIYISRKLIIIGMHHAAIIKLDSNEQFLWAITYELHESWSIIYRFAHFTSSHTKLI